MAIRTYIENDKKFFEVYVNGSTSRGERVQRKRNGIESLKKAQSIEFELRRELAMLKEQKVPLRFEEWFERCLKQMKIDMRASTVYNYQSQIQKWIMPHWKGIEIRNITKADVHETIYEKCSEIRTPHTRRTILKFVKRIFQMAVENGELDRNPCIGLEVKVPEVEQKVFTTSEAETFLRHAASMNHPFYPIWAFALMTGMRSGEMFALRWSDIDLDGRLIHVTRQWTSKAGFSPTKTRKSRIVPISDALLIFLTELKLQRGQEESVLPLVRAWKKGDQGRVTRNFCKLIGVTQVKFHDLRATFITNLLSRGESLARVMAIVGHHQLSTTNGYLRRAGVDVFGGTEKLGYTLPQMHEAQVLRLKKLER